MFTKKFYYLITLQYLGYRFHGWQKQPDVKTLHLMVDRTLNFIMEGKQFKSLASGKLFNTNLPQDIRALTIKEVDAKFNIINNPKVKEYLYLFAFGDKFHPFCAPILTTILDDLDIELMKQGAKLFEGKHFLKTYCYKPSNNGIYNREILTCEIVENTIYTASFFPKQSYLLRIRGKGFMRNQIRLMMGTLIDLGKGKLNLEDIKASLEPNNTIKMEYIAPASGLILKSVAFE